MQTQVQKKKEKKFFRLDPDGVLESEEFLASGDGKKPIQFTDVSEKTHLYFLFFFFFRNTAGVTAYYC